MRTIAAAIAVLSLSAALPRGARADRHELAIGSAARWLPSGSADALTDDDMGVFSMSGARTISWVSLPGVELLAEGTFEIGGVGGTSFQRIESDALVVMGAAGVRARRRLGSRLMLGARASLAMARVDVTLRDSFSDTLAVSDGAWTPAAYVGAGIDFTPLRARDARGGDRFALGLRAELGYLAMASVDVTGKPQRMDEEGTIRIPAAESGLGALDLSALSLRIALVSRF